MVYGLERVRMRRHDLKLTSANDDHVAISVFMFWSFICTWSSLNKRNAKTHGRTHHLHVKKGWHHEIGGCQH